MKTTKNIFTGVPNTYAELVQMHEPRPIHNEAEFDAAEQIVLKMAGHRLNRDQDDYLDVMTTLLRVYDQAHHALKLKELSPLEALDFLLEEHQMTASDLGRVLGNRALGAKILRGERELSKSHIVLLAKRFSVNPSLFLAEKKLLKRAG